MNLSDCQNLYDFNAWANRRTLESCASLTPKQFTTDLKSSFGSVRDTLAHIYGAEWIWLERIFGRTPTSFPAASDFPDLESVRMALMHIDQHWIDYANSVSAEDLKAVRQFQTKLSGQISLPLWQVFHHVANHSTYHRGQIATMLRQLAAKAASTDLILFFREHPIADAAKTS
jgi:uncharacterized damage-inducible protein DinB